MVYVTEKMEYVNGVKMGTGDKFVKMNAEKAAQIPDVRKSQGVVKTVKDTTGVMRAI